MSVASLWMRFVCKLHTDTEFIQWNISTNEIFIRLSDKSFACIFFLKSYQTSCTHQRTISKTQPPGHLFCSHKEQNQSPSACVMFKVFIQNYPALQMHTTVTPPPKCLLARDCLNNCTLLPPEQHSPLLRFSQNL